MQDEIKTAQKLVNIIIDFFIHKETFILFRDPMMDRPRLHRFERITRKS